MRLLLTLILAAQLTGCIPAKRNFTREEWLALTSRTYPVGKEAAIAAAEKILLLADGKDTTIVHQPDGFTAVRKWSVYYVLGFASGTHYWRIAATENNGATRLDLQLSAASGGMVPLPTAQGDYSAGSMPANTAPWANGNAVYLLFWRRLDHLLGQGADWISCASYREEISGSETVWGNTEPLCLNAADLNPDGSKPAKGDDRSRMAGVGR